MTKATEPIAETWLCIDCMIAHEEGRMSEVHGVTPIADITANWGATEENDEDEEDGIRTFSGSLCPTCDTGLAGYRYRYAVWAW